ncbi:hypothetical protein CRG98_006421 [Punica granatum]|uniref:Uncharacterized protein n=1 Tax=Punica granatum TaxID=22663 RepID=A0A2I0KXG5_PUNGR|nr:hypothetical protein CRG98_006421 [Punica granatum]
MPRLLSLLSITALFIGAASPPPPRQSTLSFSMETSNSDKTPIWTPWNRSSREWRERHPREIRNLHHWEAIITSINFASHNFSRNNYSSKDSLSTQPSLSRLKDQLLSENPNIYHFSEIRAATDDFSARRFSSAQMRSLIKALVSVSISNASNQSLIEATRLRSKPC